MAVNPSSPLLTHGTRRAGNRRAVFVAGLMVALGVCAAALLASSMGDHSIMAQSSRRISLIGMGAAAESANDIAVLNALGKVEGDTEKDTKKATEEAVKKAEEETAAAVKAEIDEAVTKGETEGKAGYAADIEKYKGQEASMGHKGWVDVYANSMREAGLSVKGVAGRAAALQQLAAAQAGSKGAKGRK